MANPVPSFIPNTTVDVANATTQKITNIIITNANTEQSLTLETNLKQILIKVREEAELKFTLASGESGTNYLTLEPYNTYCREDLDLAAGVLYFQSPTSGVTLEIEQWS